MWRNDENLINRRKQSGDGAAGCGTGAQNDGNEYTERSSLTLAEQLYVLALRDGRTSFWNDNLSVTLRACLLVDLSLRGRIDLEPATAKYRTLALRRIRLRDGSLTGERLLDASLKLIKAAPEPACVSLWLEYLNGENWNPWTWRYQLKSVKEHLGKDLAEKGVLSIHKVNFVLFENVTYPLKDEKMKLELIALIRQTLLQKWKGTPSRIDLRCLALLVMSYCADLHENLFADLTVNDFNLSKKRMHVILDCDCEKEAKRNSESEVLWAILSALLK